MNYLWDMLHFFCMYSILSIQYFFCGTSPVQGPFTEVAPLESLPFIVSLNNRAKLDMYNTPQYNFSVELAHFCGGSLITRKHVLTAAHCFIKFNRFDEVVVKIGSTNLRTVASLHDVSWWRTYCQFYNIRYSDQKYENSKDYIFDIAIMELEDCVSSDFPLPTISYIPDEELYGKLAVMGGWGRIEGNKRPRNMKIGRFFILSPEHCNVNHLMPDNVLEQIWPQIFLCSDSSCARTAKGDSGSPVLYGGADPDYPNNIIGVHRGSCPRGSAAACQFMNMHASVNAYRGFIDSLTQIVDCPDV